MHEVKILASPPITSPLYPDRAPFSSDQQSVKNTQTHDQFRQSTDSRLYASSTIDFLPTQNSFHYHTSAPAPVAPLSYNQHLATASFIPNQYQYSGQIMPYNRAWHPREHANHSNGQYDWSSLHHRLPESSSISETSCGLLKPQHYFQAPPNGYLDPRTLQRGWSCSSHGHLDIATTLNHREASTPRENTPYSSDSRSVSPFLANSPMSTNFCPQRNGSPNNRFVQAESGHVDEDDDEGSTNIPYNRLLFKCFMDMQGHEALLKDIYAWFEQNTDKARDPRQKGWQNSIRHNLSMNEAFVRGSRLNPSCTPPNSWMLSDAAIKNGVEPTTRFRNHQRPPTKGKSLRNPYPLRQVSGAKGGRAARRSARLCMPGNGGWQSQSPPEHCMDMCSGRSTPFDHDELSQAFQPTRNDTESVGLAVPFDGGVSSGFTFDGCNGGLMQNLNAFDTYSRLTNEAPVQNCQVQHVENWCSSTGHPGLTPSTNLEAAHSANEWTRAVPPPAQGTSLSRPAKTPPLDAVDLDIIETEGQNTDVFESDDSPSPMPKTPDITINEDFELKFGSDFFDIGAGNDYPIQEEHQSVKSG